MAVTLTEDSIPSQIKVVAVDTENPFDFDMSEWELVDRHYDVGKWFLLLQHIDKDVIERVLDDAKAKQHDDYHNSPGGMLHEETRVFDDEGEIVEAKNEWD